MQFLCCRYSTYYPATSFLLTVPMPFLFCRYSTLYSATSFLLTVPMQFLFCRYSTHYPATSFLLTVSIPFLCCRYSAHYHATSFLLTVPTGCPLFREKSGKSVFLQCQGKVREFVKWPGKVKKNLKKSVKSQGILKSCFVKKM